MTYNSMTYDKVFYIVAALFLNMCAPDSLHVHKCLASQMRYTTFGIHV